MRKFIIDTDAGVDDAVAIAMALDAHKRGEIRVLAITCVTGNTLLKNVLVNVLRTIHVMDCPNIPVFSGANEAIVVPHNVGVFHGKDGLNDVEFDDEPDVSRIKSESAVSAISRLVEENPNEITIVTLGPLTNVALAFKTDPIVPSLIKEFYIMGGNVEGKGNTGICGEMNFVADVEAAYIVLERIECPCYITPLELCTDYSRLETEWRFEVLGKIESKVADFLNRIERPWYETKFKGWKWYQQWDQLTMLAALDKESILKSTSCKATVELSGTLTRGQMIVERREHMLKSVKNNVIVIKEMSIDMLKSYFLRTFQGV